MALADVLGHARIQGLLKRAIVASRVPPALLFAGPEGVGKQKLALAFARALVCARADGDCCEQCTHCGRVLRAIAALEESRAAAEKGYSKPADAARFNFRLHPDVVLVEPPPRGRRPEILAAQAEDLVRETFKAPFEARARVFVIDDAHALSAGTMVTAANALLKSLEEPPPRTHFVLVTAQPQALPATIRSRCQTLRFGALPLATIAEFLRKQGVAADEARLRSALSGGSLGVALALDSEEWQAEREAMLLLLDRAPKLDPVARLRAADDFRELPDTRRALTTLRGLLRDVALLHAGSPRERLINVDLASRLAAVSSGPVGARAGVLAEAAAGARDALAAYANEAITLDRLVEQIAGV